MMENNGRQGSGRQINGRGSMLRIRWALTALSFVLAVVLLASGSVLIGGIVGVMAVTRVVMLLQWQRRAHDLRQRYAGRTTDE